VLLQTLQTKQEWVNKPDMPAGVSQPGLMELAVATIEVQRQMASGEDAAVDDSSTAAAAKSNPNGSGSQLVADAN
jgi:hypothetical protein